MDYVWEFVFSALFERLFALVSAVAIMIWGKVYKKTNWPAPVAIVYGVVLAAAILVIFNQINWEPPTDVKIRQWLDDVQFSVKKVPTGPSDAFNFRFEVTSNIGAMPVPEVKFYVTHPKYASSGFIVMETGYDIENSFSNLKNVSSGKRQQLWRQWQKELALKGLVYTFDQRGVVLACGIPYSSLTQDRLMQCYEHLMSGLMIVTHTTGLALGE